MSVPATPATGASGPPRATVNPLERLVRSVDSWQQHHRRAALVFGVIKKYGDDRGSALAGLMTYYGFLALFPLLLALTTILGFVFRRDPAVQHTVLNSALRDFPIIGNQLGQAIHPLHANGVGLVVGIAGLLYGGLGVTQVGQFAMAQLWNIPNVVRPNLLTRMIRGAALLGILAAGVVGTSVLASLSTFGELDRPLKMTGAGLSVVFNIVLFVAGFRVMTPRQIETRSLIPGAVAAGIAWSALQAFGGYVVGHQLRHASEVYGFFATVLGLLSWIYLGAQIALYAAESNVVRARHLWPRSIVQPPLTDADRRTLADIALQEERRPEQEVDVRFRDGPGDQS